MPCLSIAHNPNVGPLLQLSIWAPGFVPPQTVRSPSASPLPMKLYMALADTGASSTCISQKVISDIGLTPMGKILAGHAQGSAAVNQYQFQVIFAFPTGSPTPAGVVPTQIVSILVTGIEFLPQPGSVYDVLLGRDILCRGIFTMSFDGHATFAI